MKYIHVQYKWDTCTVYTCIADMKNTKRRMKCSGCVGFKVEIIKISILIVC